jgi:hypothetical protein
MWVLLISGIIVLWYIVQWAVWLSSQKINRLLTVTTKNKTINNALIILLVVKLLFTWQHYIPRNWSFNSLIELISLVVIGAAFYIFSQKYLLSKLAATTPEQEMP